MPSSIQGLSNARILNKVRDNSSIDYQNRVPVATQGNLSEVLRSIESYTPAWNTFVQVLLDECALPLYRQNSWQNGLAKFKTARIRRGSWVKEVGFGLIQAHSYDKTATNVFGLEEPEVVVNFHLQNRKDKYKISIDDEALGMAVQTDGELGQLSSGILNPVQNSDNLDEYLIMRELFPKYNENVGAFNYQVPDLSLSSDLEADTKKITQMLKEVAGLMRYPNQNARFCPSGLPYMPKELVFFATPAFLSRNDVYNLASAFNVEYGKFVADVVQEVDSFQIGGAQCAIADRDWFVCTDTRIDRSSVLNNDGDFYNHFLHHWGVYSYSLLAPFVLFSTASDSQWVLTTPTYTGVTLQFADGATYANRAQNTQLVAAVQGENNPSQAVSYSITGNTMPLSTNTYIDGSGKLWVGSDERNGQIIVTATSLGDPTKSASLAVGIGKAAVTGDVTQVAIGGGSSVERGGTLELTATTTPAGGQVVWQVLGGVDSTYIDGSGTLHCSDRETASELTVLAISATTPSKMGTRAVTVTDPE